MCSVFLTLMMEILQGDPMMWTWPEMVPFSLLVVAGLGAFEFILPFLFGWTDRIAETGACCPHLL